MRNELIVFLRHGVVEHCSPFGAPSLKKCGGWQPLQSPQTSFWWFVPEGIVLPCLLLTMCRIMASRCDGENGEAFGSVPIGLLQVVLAAVVYASLMRDAMKNKPLVIVAGSLSSFSLFIVAGSPLACSLFIVAGSPLACSLFIVAGSPLACSLFIVAGSPLACLQSV